MGNRAVVHVKHAEVWIYTHWGGFNVLSYVAAALKNYLKKMHVNDYNHYRVCNIKSIDVKNYLDTKKWNRDGAHDLAGYVAAEITKTDEICISSTTWYEEQYIELDSETRTVKVYVEHPGREWELCDWIGSFSEYVARFENNAEWPKLYERPMEAA